MTQRETICALGAGRMGRGIAHAFAYAGHPVQLVDLKPRSRSAADQLQQQAHAEIRQNLATLVSLGAWDGAAMDAVMARIRFVPFEAAKEHLAESDIVFEGVPEVMQAKQAAFELAGAYLRNDAIVASTTSTFLSTELAKHIPNPERFLNAHWLNPAYLIPLVELSPHQGTATAVVNRLKTLLERIGKTPVTCAPIAGYIVPRLQALIMNEAARMIEQGVASAEDIDRATRFGFGIRYAGMGVVEFIDYGGNDILYYASRYLTEALNDERYKAPAIVEEHMQAGRNGFRDGAGFYDWEQKDADQYQQDTLQRLVDLVKLQGLLPPPAAD